MEGWTNFIKGKLRSYRISDVASNLLLEFDSVIRKFMFYITKFALKFNSLCLNGFRI